MANDPSNRAGVVVEIDLAGIVDNWRSLAMRVKPASCAAVVKADAYGSGVIASVHYPCGGGLSAFLRRRRLDEGIALRRALPATCQIAVLNGPLPGSAEEFVFASTHSRPQ